MGPPSRDGSKLRSVPMVGEYEVTPRGECTLQDRIKKEPTGLELMHFALTPRPSKLSFMAWGEVIHKNRASICMYVFAQLAGWGLITCRLIALLAGDCRSLESANTNSRLLLHPFTSQAGRYFRRALILGSQSRLIYSCLLILSLTS